MSKVAVVYWSGTGNTEAMADAVVKSVKEAGAEVDLFTATKFSSALVENYTAFAFGCPPRGDEVLEDSEFEPMFIEVASALAGKSVALFGSYGWGGGIWMENWEEDCKAKGIVLATESVICLESPDDEAIGKLTEMGKTLSKI